jgi:hypothetical protein
MTYSGNNKGQPITDDLDTNSGDLSNFIRRGLGLEVEVDEDYDYDSTGGYQFENGILAFDSFAEGGSPVAAAEQSKAAKPQRPPKPQTHNSHKGSKSSGSRS